MQFAPEQIIAPAIIYSEKFEAWAAKAKEKDIYRVVVTPDAQFPYEDRAACDAVEQYVRDNRFDEWIDLGDFMDFDFLSTHNEGKHRLNAGKLLKQHYAYGREVLDRRFAALRSHNKKASMTIIEGNHDARVEAFIDKNPQLEGMLEVEEGLGLKERGIQWIRFWRDGTIYKIGKAAFCHGLYTSKYHAAKMVENYCSNIFYGHCFDEATQLLTQRGWLNYQDITDGDICLTMNKESQLMEWQPVNRKYVYNAPPEMVEIKNSNIDLLVDPSHGLVGRDVKSKELKFFKAAKLLEGGQYDFKVSGYSTIYQTEYEVSDSMLKLLAWIYAEGTLYTVCTSPYIEITQSKQKGIDEIQNLLTELNLSHKLATATGSKASRLPAYRFRLHASAVKKLMPYLRKGKDLPDWFWKLSDRQFQIFLAEYIKGDGTTYTGKHKSQRLLYCNNPEWVDAFQARLFLTGHKTTVYWRTGGFLSNKKCAQINIFEKEWVQVTKSRHVRLVPYSGRMWCVNVDNGTLVVRRNGRVMVTQNTHDVMESPKVMHGKDEVVVGQSMGCLCRLDQAYIKQNPKNWQLAFGDFFFNRDGLFTYYVPRIFNSQFVAPTGKVYKGRG